MEQPKRARTAAWESGVLTLDGEKRSEIPELTVNLIGQLVGHTLVGFHVEDYPVSDELFAAFAGHKSMVSSDIENATFIDACFPIFSVMPKLRYPLPDGNAVIHGSGLSALQNCKPDLLTLNRIGLDDDGLLQTAATPKLSHIQIDRTAITCDNLLTVVGNSRIEPVVHEQFTGAQMEHFFYTQWEKTKRPAVPGGQTAEKCRRVLSVSFVEMTEWEQYMEQAGLEDSEATSRPLAVWEKYVSEKPCPGYRSLTLSYSVQSIYNGEWFLDAKQLIRSKLYIYTREKSTSFNRRFLVKRVDGSWKIDAMQGRSDG